MFRKRYIAAIILLVVVGPVVIRQLFPPEPRQYSGVTLDQVQYTEVTFRNEAQNLDLAGMLFTPDGEGPFPAAVIIHGSGTSNRQNRWYLTLTKHLQDNGVAVLLPDKRGSEKSSGNWRTSSFEDLATDTVAAIEFVETQELTPVSGVGIIGMSQGGWIAPIVARDTDDLEFIVSMVGSAVTPNEQLLFEEDHNVRQMGFLPGVSYVIAQISTRHIRHFVMPEIYDAVGDYDPIPLWGQVDIPVLAILGSEDTNVPSAESAARLEALGSDSIQVVIYEGSGHAVQDPPGHGDRLIRAEALDAIAGFVLDSSAGDGARN